MTGQTTNATATADREITITRTFDAPRELVFRAFTATEHLVHWWGPNGFTTTYHQHDFRPGGVARFTMHGPDGVDYPNRIDYLEVTPPERLVYNHSDDDGEKGIAFHVTITFDDHDGKTELTLRTLFPTVEARERAVQEFHAIEGGNQTLARLAEYLKTM